MCVFIVNQCTVVSNIYLNLNDAKKNIYYKHESASINVFSLLWSERVKYVCISVHGNLRL